MITIGLYWCRKGCFAKGITVTVMDSSGSDWSIRWQCKALFLVSVFGYRIEIETDGLSTVGSTPLPLLLILQLLIGGIGCVVASLFTELT